MLVVESRRHRVGRRTASSRGPNIQFSQGCYERKICYLRFSSGTEAKNVEKAFQVSVTAAVCDSVIVPSCTNGATLAMNSTRPGIRSLTQCRSIRLPLDEAPASVLAHWAAVRKAYDAQNMTSGKRIVLHTSSPPKSFCETRKHVCSITALPTGTFIGITVSIKTTASILVLTFRADISPTRPLLRLELFAR